MDIDFKDLKPGYEFASWETYFDVWSEGKPVAHIRRPQVMDKNRRWYVRVYDGNMIVKGQEMTYTPIVTTRKMVNALQRD